MSNKKDSVVSKSKKVNKEKKTLKDNKEVLEEKPKVKRTRKVKEVEPEIEFTTEFDNIPTEIKEEIKVEIKEEAKEKVVVEEPKEEKVEVKTIKKDIPITKPISVNTRSKEKVKEPLKLNKDFPLFVRIGKFFKKIFNIIFSHENIKFTILGIIILLLLIVIMVTNNIYSKLVGKWEYFEESTNQTYVITFAKDGTGTYKFGDKQTEFIYKDHDTYYTIRYTHDSTSIEKKYKIRNRKLTVCDQIGNCATYKKK